ncbi:ribonucleotide-diphosphate reductase subunit beta [bacterium]|nr:ribonucleotide-diphosphate reductase subunit beta [bacterium]
MEPLLTPTNEKRYAMLPIPPNEMMLYKMWKRHVSTFWTLEEVKMENDARDFQSLTPEEQHFLKVTLSFFAMSDELVAANLEDNFMKEVKRYPMVHKFWGIQRAMEDIHSECYSLLIETLIQDPKEKWRLYHGVETIPCIQRKAQWLGRYMTRSRPFVERLLAFALFEGCAFSASFASIYFLREQHRGKLNGVCFSNELISRDESLHAEFAIMLYVHYIEHKLDVERAHEIVESLLKVEREFVTTALPTSLIGLSPVQMCKYVEFCADSILERMQMPKMYNHKECPLTYMRMIDMNTKTNFFEGRAGEYAMADAHSEKVEELEDF